MIYLLNYLNLISLNHCIIQKFQQLSALIEKRARQNYGLEAFISSQALSITFLPSTRGGPLIAAEANVYTHKLYVFLEHFQIERARHPVGVESVLIRVSRSRANQRTLYLRDERLRKRYLCASTSA